MVGQSSHETLGSTESSPAKVTAVNNVKLCPEIICTMEFIPEQCRETPVIEKNGVQCYGCPVWKARCRDNSAGMGEQTPKVCPVPACTLEFIPDECREIPKVNISGLLCDGCPRWREGCNETAASSVNTEQRFQPRPSCPLLICAPVPLECRVTKSRSENGQNCELCPEWRQGCREQERQAFMNSQNNAAPNQCPQVQCESKIPEECQEPQPFQFKGMTCYKCPKWRAECTIVLPNTNEQPKIVVDSHPQGVTCPRIDCERVPGMHRSCYQREFYNYKGKTCEKCSSIKPECQQFVPIRPFVDVIPRRDGAPEKACPLMACPTLLIPDECRTVEMFAIDGKMCPGCPKEIKGCVASKPIPVTNSGLNKAKLIPDVGCPLKACTLMLIPPECREEQPYNFNGKTCYDCPRWKDGCRPNSELTQSSDSTIPDVACPMFGCPRIFIPRECREEQPFQFQGKTCYKCPKWRKSCRPGKPQILPLAPPVERAPMSPEIACPMRKCPKLDVPADCIVEKTYEFMGKTCVDCPTKRPDCPARAPNLCPQIMCPAVQIPEACREEQSFDFKGQICKLCPRWRPGCKPGHTNDRTNQLDPTGGITPSPVPTAKEDNSLPVLTQTTGDNSIMNLNGVLPVRDIVSKVNSLSCPPLPCPEMLIPFHCKEETTYQYEGRTCKGCPRWRIGCRPTSGDPFTLNPNGYVLLLPSVCLILNHFL